MNQTQRATPAEHSASEVGEVAGMVWKCLKDNGPMTLSKLSREIEAPRDLIMQGVGWLAREGKIHYFSGERHKRIGLYE